MDYGVSDGNSIDKSESDHHHHHDFHVRRPERTDGGGQCTQNEDGANARTHQ